jgi:tRNA-dihydrouridine synthase B
MNVAPGVRPLLVGSVVIDPPVLMAPMAGFTNHAFRQIVRRLGGCGLPVTEMISARGFREMDVRRGEVPERLWGLADEPRPLAVQIWDNDAGLLAEMGLRLVREFGATIIDINFGCPAPDVSQKAQSGAYLLQFPDRVGAIVARVVEACAPVPVTAKIRLGVSRESNTAAEVAQAVEAAGGAALTVHGRYAADFYRGQADWAAIAAIKPHLRRIPLIGNGDLHSADDVLAALRRYEVDAVMVGRAGLKNPWLYREARASLLGAPAPARPSDAEQKEILYSHWRLNAAQFGDQKATILMRKFACCYSHGRAGARVFRERLGTVASFDEFARLVEEHFGAQNSPAT